MTRRLQRGFTMIELLIVIAVLAVLAVAVLSAINPIEQINRGKDTAKRSDAEQILTAIERYFAAQQYYPWQTAPNELADSIGWIALSAAEGENSTGVLSALAENEIKIPFANRLRRGDSIMYISKANGVGNGTYVCFAPLSGSVKKEAAGRCATAAQISDFPIGEACGVAAATCGSGSNCICVP